MLGGGKMARGRQIPDASRNPKLTQSTSSPSLLAALTPPSNIKYVLAMVGLPARGKSYIVKMIMRYLRWTGIKSEIFNVGNYRRKMDFAAVSADFFDKGNLAAQVQREQLALDVQDDMYRWLHAQDDLAVAFFDATNTTQERRRAITKRAKTEPSTLPSHPSPPPLPRKCHCFSGWLSHRVPWLPKTICGAPQIVFGSHGNSEESESCVAMRRSLLSL